MIWIIEVHNNGRTVVWCARDERDFVAKVAESVERGLTMAPEGMVIDTLEAAEAALSHDLDRCYIYKSDAEAVAAVKSEYAVETWFDALRRELVDFGAMTDDHNEK